MKDFLPTFTFGFLMAQLFPGAVTVLCITCPYAALTVSHLTTAQGGFFRMIGLFESVGDLWFGSTRNAVVFLFFAAATGMFLHGIDWMILGWETQKCNDKGIPIPGDDGVISLCHLAFHNQPLWKQFLLAPLNMLREIFRLFRAPALTWITMDENLPEISPASLPLFNWLQDFYLYFGQFYIHMSYSLLIGFFSMAVTYSIIGTSLLRILFLVFLYFLASLFFLMGRTQLASLFKNEDALITASQDGKDKPYEVVVTNKPYVP